MRSSVLLITVIAAVAACSQAPADAPAASTAAPASAPAPAAAATPVAAPAQASADAALPKVGESYWPARKRLVAAGYSPVNATTEGRTVCVQAMEEEREISPEECVGEKMLLPEVEDCAGTGAGNCVTHWHAPDGRNLTIYTVDGPQPGVVSELEWSPAGGPVGQN